MKLTKVFFLFSVFYLIFFFLSNLLQYPSREGIISGKPFLVFGVLTPYITSRELFFRDILGTSFVYFLIIVPVGVLIVNVIVQAVVRRWRLFKTLISFYIPISLIPTPLIMSWCSIGYVNTTSVLHSFLVFVYTSLAMIYARITLRRVTKINASKTGVCVLFVCFVLVNLSFH